jgi:hypothetical protein
MIVLGPFAATNRTSASAAPMPSLFRFLVVVAFLGVVVYVGLYALAHFVQPKPREISVSIPPDKFFKNR